MASWHADTEYADEHAGGQLRLGVVGDQRELLPLEDERIPTSDEPRTVDGYGHGDELELGGARFRVEVPFAPVPIRGQTTIEEG